MKILAFESSCDETAAAVIEDGRKICSNIINSQAEEHALYGGVVPEIASRGHVEAISAVAHAAVREAGMAFADVDAIAATCAPGLIGALLVGANYAKSLAWSLHKPFIPVHHIRGHIAANLLAFPELEPPFLCLSASGGSSMLVLVHDYTDMEIIGGTRDDAAGEAFDKVARVLGVGYPGGPKIDQLARGGDDTAYALPHSHVDGAPLDFSFSGLKTAVINLAHHAEQKGEPLDKRNLAACFQRAVSETLVPRLKLAAEQTGVHTLVAAGGVAANSRLRADLECMARELGAPIYMPPLHLCGDNAAMIGAQAYYEYLAGNTGTIWQNAFATAEIQEKICQKHGIAKKYAKR
ncbi:MAG: tRNA (adenosine(37)-N6)-threonylcarbamoyltransferase complex transferase subunit TsaD [Eubacteriales bacterium]|nr:tRNA (adenosine(37)-N6)-threonylcarbamoyltransferase complex transferase subunit TsaD [Eubacteriales bacterium]